MRSRLSLLASAIVVALAVVGVLALVGVFGGGGGRSGGGSALPAVAPAFAQESSNRINQIYSRERDSVLLVQARIVSQQQSPFGPQLAQGISTGTGWLIDDKGSVVTNAHVVENAQEVAIRLGENRLLKAKVVGVDEGNDLALLHVDPTQIKAKRCRSATPPRSGWATPCWPSATRSASSTRSPPASSPPSSGASPRPTG